MGKLGTQLAKIMLLAGGAIIGTLLGRWVDELMTTQSKERAEHDKMRYERGLGPLEPAPQPPLDRQQEQG